jgi:hypothetical protein
MFFGWAWRLPDNRAASSAVNAREARSTRHVPGFFLGRLAGGPYLEWTNRVAVRPPNIGFVTEATLPVAMPTWTAWLVYRQRTGVSSTSVNACQDVFATLGTFANSETEFACLPTTGRSLRSHSKNNNGERQNSSNRCMRYLRRLHLRHLRAPSGTDVRSTLCH